MDVEKILQQICDLYQNCKCIKCEEEGVRAYFNRFNVKCQVFLNVKLKLCIDPHHQHYEDSCEFPRNLKNEKKFNIGFVDHLVIIHIETTDGSIPFLILLELKKTYKSPDREQFESILNKFSNTLDFLLKDGILINEIDIVTAVCYKKFRGAYKGKRFGKRPSTILEIHGKKLNIEYIKQNLPLCRLQAFQKLKI